MFSSVLPKKLFDSIYDITPEYLRENGISVIFSDLDDTLGTTAQKEIGIAAAEWINGLRSRGIEVIVVSNSGEKRVSHFCAPALVRYIAGAKKPLTGGMKKALELSGKQASQAAVLGDQLFTDMLCANLLGMKKLAVKPCGTDPVLSVKIKRVLEKPLWRHYRAAHTGKE